MDAKLLKTTVGIEGMFCASCTAAIEKFLLKLEDVESANVILAANSATVTYDPSAVSLDDFEKAVTDAGYKALRAKCLNHRNLRQSREKVYT